MVIPLFWGREHTGRPDLARLQVCGSKGGHSGQLGSALALDSDQLCMLMIFVVYTLLMHMQ